MISFKVHAIFKNKNKNCYLLFVKCKYVLIKENISKTKILARLAHARELHHFTSLFFFFDKNRVRTQITSTL